MSTGTKQITPARCYCSIQNDLTNLNDIVNVITFLNSKIRRLRNEVSALNDINGNDKKRLFKEPDITRKKKLDTFPTDVKHDKSTILQRPGSSADLSESDRINCNKIDNEVNKNDNSTPNKISRTGLENSRRIRRKKISKGVQCDPVMERKRKRFSLNCFKIKPNTKKHNPLKQRKRRKISKANVHVTFDPRVDIAGEDTPIKIESKIEKETINSIEKFSENEMFQKDPNTDKDLKRFLPARLGGGAEFRGNRGIFDFNDKVQAINLYKNVKFDAQNVKKRLDACIVQLNGIIEDISLILPDADIRKKLEK